MTLPDDLEYQTGFGNEHETEALPGALPKACFSPQKVAYGLYCEQFSTTAFTAPKHQNRRTWTYRIHPSAVQGDYQPWDNNPLLKTAPLTDLPPVPSPLRWDPLPVTEQPTDFISGLTTIAANGDARTQIGTAIHLYAANQSMEQRFFYNADGELLIVPQAGGLLICTELGRLQVEPGDIAVIPRGIKFRVELLESKASGYVCENYGAPLTLPERGPVGANGFANDRDFQYPVAWYEDKEGTFELVSKFSGHLYCCELTHSPWM